MRRPRILVDGARYHVIARANRGEFMLESDRVKDLFLQVVSRAQDRFDFSIEIICIMGNHIHMIVLPGSGNSLSRVMQWMLSVFAIHYNRLFGLRGHVWYDRFKSIVLGSLRQFARAYAYIRNNPVHAGIARSPDEYRYCGSFPPKSSRSSPIGIAPAIAKIDLPRLPRDPPPALE